MVAVGNGGPQVNTVGFPSYLPEVISVGAHYNHYPLSFSSRGPVHSHSLYCLTPLLLASPTSHLHSTRTGTSHATPLVASYLLTIFNTIHPQLQ